MDKIIKVLVIVLLILIFINHYLQYTYDNNKKIYKVENGFIFRLSQEISNSNAHEDILIY